MKISTIPEGLYGACLMALLIPLNPILRSWHLKWGCNTGEDTMTLPGDELVGEMQTNATHAITIHKPVADIWPWIVQIGTDRGGFYSYDFLENLVGCRLQSVDHIVPAWQNLKPGDTVSLHPKAPGLSVAILQPGKSLVLGAVWGFHLKTVDSNTTRFIVRARGVFNTGIKNPVGNFIIWRMLYEPIHFIMERKMMLNIKKLAEKSRISSDKK